MSGGVQLPLFEVGPDRGFTDAARRCLDCNVDTIAIAEYYMVSDDIWANSGVGPLGREGMLCIGCLEGRLGRRLTADDFTDAPTNRCGRRSERLLNRMLEAER